MNQLKPFKTKWQKEVKKVQKDGGRYSQKFKDAVFKLGQDLPFKSIAESVGVAPSVFYRWFPGNKIPGKKLSKKEIESVEEIETVEMYSSNEIDRQEELTENCEGWSKKQLLEEIIELDRRKRKLEDKLTTISRRFLQSDIVDGIRTLLDDYPPEREIESCMTYCKLLIDKTIDYCQDEIGKEDFKKNY